MPTLAVSRTAIPRFWRDAALPFLEAREVLDGRSVCYERHSHETFSIGAITEGTCLCHHQGLNLPLTQGDVVVFNAGEVHACNPLDGRSWAYLMFYLDAAWLARLQRDLGLNVGETPLPLPAPLWRDESLHRELCRLFTDLDDTDNDTLARQCRVTDFFTRLHARTTPVLANCQDEPSKLRRAIDYIHAHWRGPVTLEALAQASDLSESYLIRLFRRHYAMTPHAYLVNHRVQQGQRLLRLGRPLVEVAQETGFADQAHFQRSFKRLLAVTPGHYRG